jgi:hypothetical protein
MAKAKASPTPSRQKEPTTGIVRGDDTYTHHGLAKAIGRTPEWVVDNVVEKGCPAREAGWLWLISGRDFRQWVENGAAIKVKSK